MQYDKDTRKPIQATKEEFVTQFVDLYTRKDANGLGLKVNRRFVEEVADVLTKHSEDGRCMDIEKDAPTATLMDKLAYEPKLSSWYEAMDRGENLFDGRNNSLYAPKIVRSNIAVLGTDKEQQALVMKDTVESYKPKNKSPELVGRKAKPKDPLAYEDVPGGIVSSEEEKAKGAEECPVN